MPGRNGTKGELGETGQPGNVVQKGEPGLKGDIGPPGHNKTICKPGIPGSREEPKMSGTPFIQPSTTYELEVLTSMQTTLK